MITINDILKSACGIRNAHLKEKRSLRARIKRKDCEQVLWMHIVLKEFAEANKLWLVKEYKFATNRKFRSDFAFPAEYILIEYEGIISEKSGHTSYRGYSKDVEKYNLAAQLGYKIIRFTVFNYQNVIDEIKKILNGKINIPGQC